MNSRSVDRNNEQMTKTRLDKHRSNRPNSISFSCEFHRVTERRDIAIVFLQPMANRSSARIDRVFPRELQLPYLTSDGSFFLFFFLFSFQLESRQSSQRGILSISYTEHLRNSCWPVCLAPSAISWSGSQLGETRSESHRSAPRTTL